MGIEVAVVERGEAAPHGTALAPVEQVGGLIRPVAPPHEILQAQEETRHLIAEILQEGRDYGMIPGTKEKSLHKPGAERATLAYGCYARFRVVEKEVDHDRPVHFVKRRWEWHETIRGKKVWHEEEGHSEGFYRYVVECELVHRATGIVVGHALGSCSSIESKYIDRPRDLENTILQMAEKRAHVAAVRVTFGLSGLFRGEEDELEDPRDDGGDEAAQERGKGRKATAPAQSGDAASQAQLGLVKRLAQSHVLTAEERERIEARLADGLSKGEASKLIERLKAIVEGKRQDEPTPAPAAAAPVPAPEEDDELPF